MNKRMRKKHAKQAWMRLQEKIRDPASWQRANRCSLRYTGYVAASYQEGRVRVVDDVQSRAFFVVQDTPS